MYAVIKDDGRYAGIPCLSIDEARDLSAQHENSWIFELDWCETQVWNHEKDFKEICENM